MEPERCKTSAQYGCLILPSSMSKIQRARRSEKDVRRIICNVFDAMTADRTIGRTVKIKTYQALVELAPETSSYVKSSYGGLYAIAL